MSSRPPTAAPVAALLDSLVLALHYVPNGARRAESAEDLPVCLRRRTLVPIGAAWRAWVAGVQVRFVSARRVLAASPRSLLVEFFDVDGRRVAAGIWSQGRSRVWQLEAPVSEAEGDESEFASRSANRQDS